MAFIEIEKGTWGGHKLPHNVLRVSPSTITISENIAEQFQVGRRTTEAGTEVVKLGMAVDRGAKQINLIPNPINGFSWINPSKERGGGSGYLRVTLPANFKRLGMERGDYQLIDRKNLVFQLAE